jgi:hypothetical protein
MGEGILVKEIHRIVGSLADEGILFPLPFSAFFAVLRRSGILVLRIGQITVASVENSIVC